jgi:protein-disulfide isomerase
MLGFTESGRSKVPDTTAMRRGSMAVNEPRPADNSMSRGRWKHFLDAVATIMTMGAAGAVLFVVLQGSGRHRETPKNALPVPSVPISIRGATQLGAGTARVALIEYFDFECSFCARFAKDTLPTLKTKYIDTGLVKFVLRHYPLPNHRNARSAAEAAICAERQGRGWEAKAVMFADPRQLSATVKDLASLLQLSGSAFTECQSAVAAGRIDEHIASAKQLAVSSTPAFFVGVIRDSEMVQVSKTIKGARPLSDFENALDDAMARAR